MKKIGIVGGLGPEATVEYYKEITGYFNKAANGEDIHYPDIVIYSLDMWGFLKLFDNKKFDEAVELIVKCLDKLKMAGADFAVISANTPHLLFNQIQAISKIPLISIVDCVREKAVNLGVKRCGLFGTRFTMKADFYKNNFHKNGIEVFSPGEDEIEFINHKLFSEIELGIFREETKNELLDIVKKMIHRNKIDSLILGCTEFPLIFRNEKYFDIPFLNTVRIHVDKIISECLA
ncbi:MAG: amino acid racemase [Bacteroidales bacterium]|nr:amino acid racemase [Bacteroidales bacterium]